jgi:hypothetical protein
VDIEREVDLDAPAADLLDLPVVVAVEEVGRDVAAIGVAVDAYLRATGVDWTDWEDLRA